MLQLNRLLKFWKLANDTSTFENEQRFHGEYGANAFSKLTFAWLSPLLRIGFKRTLTLSDMGVVNPARSMDVLLPKFSVIMAKNLKASPRSKYFLHKTLYQTCKLEFIASAILQLLAAVLQVLIPFFIRFLVRFAAEIYQAHESGDHHVPPIGRGIGLVLGLTIMQIVQSFCTNHCMYQGTMFGNQARSVLIASIQEQAMKLPSYMVSAGSRTKRAGSGFDSAEATSQTDTVKHPKKSENIQNHANNYSERYDDGYILNLVATDASRIDQCCATMHILWTTPIQILLALALMSVNLKASTLAGFGFILLLVPGLAFGLGRLAGHRRAISDITVQRTSLILEIINSAKFIKCFAWETLFLNRLQALRQDESSRIAKVLSIKGGIMAIALSMPIFASVLSFTAFSFSVKNFDPALVFSSLAIFNSLRVPLNLLATVVGQIIDALAAMDRIGRFLSLDIPQSNYIVTTDNHAAIALKNADFDWVLEPDTSSLLKARLSSDDNEMQQAIAGFGNLNGENMSADSLHEKQIFNLRNIGIEIGRGEFVAVIGAVGCGKSSLLAALAGEMYCSSKPGSLTLGASIAFCSQTGWLMNATIRDNILFGKEFDQIWYNEVLDACCLTTDLQILSHGDVTEVGERGVTLSGGQKQRINVARAIYSKAEIVLLDDPLSAIDAQVGSTMFEKAILGLLHNRTCILATHQLQFLDRVDRIIWMTDGRVRRFGTVTEISETDEGFRNLLGSFSSKRDQTRSTSQNALQQELRFCLPPLNTSSNGQSQPSSKPLMQEEFMVGGSVSLDVYSSYVKAAGSIWIAPLVLFLLILAQGSNIVANLWLSFWTSDKFHYAPGVYLAGYAGLGIAQALLIFVFSASTVFFGAISSKNMLQRAVSLVLGAPVSFFETTPRGRIASRFSKDVDTMDNMLAEAIVLFGLTASLIISVLVLIVAYYYIFAAALVPLIGIFYFFASYYRASARELKRHEAVLHSSVISRLGECVSGASTIRTYQSQKRFAKSLNTSIDSMNRSCYLSFAAQRWLSVRLDLIGALLIFVVGILVVTSRISIDPSSSGLALSYVLTIVQMLQFTIKQLAEVENNMSAAERIHEYGMNIPQERHTPSIVSKGGFNLMESNRDIEASIVFENVTMRYRPGLPFSIKNFSVTIDAGQRIGVVGRTGAGKSSLLTALLRLVELAHGRILIGGVDIATFDLHKLRSLITIIPQDPTLFHGTVRSNLDPFQEHTDQDLRDILQEFQLDSTLEPSDSSRFDLDAKVDSEGSNFSLGQRQILALARASLRSSRIVICDEPTSAIDSLVDKKIQQALFKLTRGKTTICIAHRLRTIIHYDRILVIDAGQLVGFDKPYNLYLKGGVFAEFCNNSGICEDDFC